jgi:hypothetical protein
MEMSASKQLVLVLVHLRGLIGSTLVPRQQYACSFNQALTLQNLLDQQQSSTGLTPGPRQLLLHIRSGECAYSVAGWFIESPVR